MRRQKFMTKTISAILICAILNYDVTCFAGQNESPKVAKKVVNHPIAARDFSDAKEKVYLIEDVHCVPEIQEQVADTLTHLYKDKNIESVYIEGCSGYQDFNYLRSYPLPEQRDTLLSDYMQEGKISGVEYFVSRLPLDSAVYVYGMEDNANYSKNKDVLLGFSKYDELLLEIRSAKDYFAQHIKKNFALYNESFFENYDPYDYNFIVTFFANNQVEISRSLINKYPNISNFFQTLAYLSEVNLDEVIREGYDLCDILDENDSFKWQVKKRILALVLNPSASERIDETIIEQIESNCSFQNIYRYLSALKIKNSPVWNDISDKFTCFFEDYAYSLCLSSCEKDFFSMYFLCLRIEKLINLQFTNRQLKQYSLKILPTIPEWISADICDVLHKAVELYPSIYKESCEFYYLAQKRNQYLQNSLLMHRQRSKRSCAVVVGGFHSKSFQTFFRENDIPFEVIHPHLKCVNGLDRNIYFQHFASKIQSSHYSVPMPNSLAPSPILSLSQNFTYSDSPQNTWFNSFLEKLIQPLRSVPAVGGAWIRSIMSGISGSGHKLKILFLASTLAVTFVNAPAAAYEYETYPLDYQERIFYLAPAETEGDDNSLDELIALYGYTYHRDVTTSDNIIEHLDSGIMHVQDAAIQLIEQKNDVFTMLRYIHYGKSLDVKQVLIGRLIASKNISALSRIALLLDSSMCGLHHKELKGVFDTMMIHTATVDPDFFSDTSNDMVAAETLALKYMLIYYMQVSESTAQQSFQRAFLRIATDEDLQGIYKSFRNSAESELGIPLMVMNGTAQGCFYTHNSVPLKQTAFEELLKRYLEDTFAQISEKSLFGIQGLLNQADRLDANDMLRLIRSKDPNALQIIQKVFPGIYASSVDYLTRSLELNELDYDIQRVRKYPFTYLVPVGRDVNRYMSFDISSDIAHQRAADLYFRIRNWYPLNTYLLWGQYATLKESMIYKYYADYPEYLASIYFRHKSSPLGETIKNVLEESLRLNPDTSFNLEEHSPGKISFLIHLSREQRKNNESPWAFEYLITHLPSEYSLAFAVHNREIEGIELTDHEAADIEFELTRRFALNSLNEFLARQQQKQRTALFTQASRDISNLEADIRMLSSATIRDVGRILEKYDIEADYHEWKQNLDAVHSADFKRKTLLNKLCDRAYMPLLAILSFLAGISMFRKIVGKLSRTTMKKSAQTADGGPDPVMEDAIGYIKDFVTNEPASISIYGLEKLEASIEKLNDRFHIIIDIDVAIRLFESLKTCIDINRENTSLQLVAHRVFIRLQKLLKAKEQKSYSTSHEEQKYFKDEPVIKNGFLSAIKILFTNSGLQNQTLKKLSSLMDISIFLESLKSTRHKIRFFKVIQFSVTTMFFGFVFLAMPIVDLSTGGIFLGILSLVQIVEHIVYHYILQSSETISKWFEFHLRRISDLSGAKGKNLSKYAYYLAMGESSQWYVMTILMNLTGAGIVISLMNPVLLIPYTLTILLSFFLIIKNLSGPDSFSTLQQTYLNGVQKLEDRFNVFGFMGKNIQIDNYWENQLSPGFSMFIKKAKLFNGTLLFLNKVMLPAIGLFTGHLLEFYIISGYLSVILGAGDFIKALGESSLYSQRINQTLSDIIKNDLVISEQTWQPEHQAQDAAVSEINPLLIESYQFSSITSSITNSIGKPVVNSVSATFKQGEMVFIGAPSGAGKSLLSNLLTYNLKPSDGSASIFLFDGKEIKISPETISFGALKDLFHYVDFSKTNGAVTVQDVLTQFSKDKSGFLDSITRIFPDFTERSLNKTFAQFSHGEQKRIILALYLYINSPAFIVLDEPLAGLDSDSAQLVMTFLTEYNNQNNSTMIVIDHNASKEMLAGFDEKMTLSAGRLLPYSKRDELAEWLNVQIKRPQDYADTEYETEDTEEVELSEHPHSFMERILSDQENHSNMDESFERLLTRIIFLVEMFGREDLNDKSVIWKELKNRNETECKIAADVISVLCQSIEKLNDTSESYDLDTALPAGTSFCNTRSVLKTILFVIQNKPDLYGSYNEHIKKSSFARLLKSVYSLKQNVRKEIIKEQTAFLADSDLQESIINSRKSVYDIMAMTYLFQKYDLDIKYFPFVLKTFSFQTFKNRLYSLLAYGLPVNTSTLRLSNDEKIKDYAYRYEVKHKLLKLNTSEPADTKQPSLKINNRCFSNLIDCAA